MNLKHSIPLSPPQGLDQTYVDGAFPHVYAVVMAGGAGTRFWPASRVMMPKQFLALGGGNEPLLRTTVSRLDGIVDPSRILIVTAQHLKEATAKTLSELKPHQILCEPVPRNTAPCVGLAIHTIMRQDPDATCIVLPSDHFISDAESFKKNIMTAINVAQAGLIVTIGMVPSRPETGYGYIEKGQPNVGPDVSFGSDAIEHLHRSYRVKRFVEKPDKQKAEEYLASGNYLWNAGIFVFRARDMAQAISEHMPALHSGLVDIHSRKDETSHQAALAAIFPKLPSVSLDYGIIEKIKNLAVVLGTFGWSDVGSWQSAWELSEKDASFNHFPDHAMVINGRGNYVRDLSSEPKAKTIALVDVENLVVVQTDDAILIIARNESQDVRKVVEELKARGQNDML